MFFLDWLIIWIPILVVIYAALRTQKYVKGVADFLSAGRVAGRYVVSVASGEAAMGLISAVALLEMYYNCGFAVSFWGTLSLPISLVLSLVGFCTYRFRETRCMTMGQFFEIRYSKSLRVTASVIQFISGIINYAIFPAVGARFLIYFLDLPVFLNLFGWHCPVFALVMAVFLGLALWIALAGGQVTIMVTDCVQGLLSYPMYVIVVAYILYRFSWSDEMMPVLMARAPHESFLNAFDVDHLRDFNLFYIFVGICGMFFNRMSWGGTMGYNGAAKSPHEAKMGGLLGTWRGGFSSMIFILLAVVALTYINHRDFAGESRNLRVQLASKTLDDIMPEPKYDATRAKLKTIYENIPIRTQYSGSYTCYEEFEKENADPYIKATTAELNRVPELKKSVQSFRTIYGQMLVPVAIRDILPMGITGIFCALMIFLMVSTDTTYMHSWGSILVQDFIVPLRRKAFTPAEQIRALRYAITGVCLFAFLFSLFFAQIDYILMFFTITGAIWAGAGVVITLGLYWKRGTTAGAYAALVSGAVIALSGILAQQFWASHLYPLLQRLNLVDAVGKVLYDLSSPFHPYIVWTMDAHKFPINSAEISFLAIVTTVLLYVVISLLTCREPFNMDRMLHRGIYSDSGKVVEKSSLRSIRQFFLLKILGIDSQYSRGDKILAWSVFLYSFGYAFGLCFLAVVVWNKFTPWPLEWWGHYFFLKNLLVAGLVGIISTFWFGICGTKDLFKLFHDLETRENDVLDDGRVEGHISTADLAHMKQIEAETNSMRKDSAASGK